MQQIERIEIALLANDPANARKHSDRNIESIVASLTRFGQQKPIVIDKSGVVRAGNGTLAAARKLGWTHINCVRTDLVGADAMAYAIADNRTAELAEWDSDVLNVTLSHLSIEGLLDSTGFTQEELDGMINASVDPSDIEEDDPPPIPIEPTTKPGDMWILGEHRLVCGSCLDMHVMEKLFNGELARMVFTDPPYNVAYVGKTKDAMTIKNDKMDDESFRQFLLDAFISIAAFTEPGSACFVCHADSEGENFRAAFNQSGFLLKQCLIWVKNTIVLGRQDYQWRHEPILYGWRSGESHRFYANRKQSTVIDEVDGVTMEKHQGGDRITIGFGGKTVVTECDDARVVYSGTDELESVWRFDKPSRNGEHPTMKPVRLAARAILHGSVKGDVVFDGFLGSGTTLIACDQTDRKCYGTEIDPKYCDVIVKRWEAMSGRKAVLDDSGHKNDSEGIGATVANQAGVSASASGKTNKNNRGPSKQPA